MKNNYSFITATILLLSLLSDFQMSQAQTGSAYSHLDINNINARFNANGSDFWNSALGTPGFEVPKGSGKHSMFLSSLWMGGLKNDTLHLAAVRYNSNGAEYYPGPIMDSSNYTTAEDAIWDKMWKISKTEVDNHLVNWNQPGYTAPADFISWPAHGDVAKGQAADLAPYYDHNNDGNYYPYDGDYPLIKGDQTIYFLRNDDRGPHNETYGEKLKIEIHGMAYAFNCPADSALYNTIFVSYQIVNRSSNTYDSTFAGFNMDPDLGDYQDDYMGSDVTSNTAYAYNGPAVDGSGAPGHYGENPPAQGMTILKGPLMDADGIDNPAGGCDESINGLGFGDGITDNERLGMTNFAYYCNPGIGGCNGSTQGDPSTAVHYYSYLAGYWKDGTRMGYGGNGHINNCTSCEPANFMFPGDSDPCNWGTAGVQPGDTNPWTEQEAGNQANDRRGIASAGPYTFEAGDTIELEIAFTFGRDFTDTLNPPAASVVVMQERIDSIRAYYNKNAGPCGEFYTGAVDIISLDANIHLFPNPANDLLTVGSSEPLEDAQFTIYNVLGKRILKGQIPLDGTIDLSSISKGAFVLTIENGANQYHQKFIKL